MWSYALKLAAAAIALLVAGVAAILLFTNIWAQVGFGAAFLVVGGALLLLAWWADRKGRRARQGIDELPPV